MKLREALKKSGWESFKNSQNEEWNITDLLNEFPEGDSPEWLDRECTITKNGIIDCFKDELCKTGGSNV